MDKFTNCANTLKLQNAAWTAFEKEKLAMDDLLGGALTEEMYGDAMAVTSAAINAAIAGGVSHKDLPMG